MSCVLFALNILFCLKQLDEGVKGKSVNEFVYLMCYCFISRPLAESSSPFLGLNISSFISRGRKPGTGRKNGGAGSKGKDKKLSGTESEQEVGTGF